MHISRIKDICHPTLTALQYYYIL